MPQPSKVVVIGGNGFIGKYLVRRLVENGYTVTVISRNVPAKSDGIQVRYVRGTVANSDDMMNAIQDASFVFDLSMGGGDSWSDYERDYLQGARNVAAACQRHNVRRLIYTSTSAALYLGGRRTITEKDGTDPKPLLRSNYSRAKAEAETILLDLHARENLPVVILRPAIVVGAGGFLSHGGVGYWAGDTCCLGWGRGNHPLPFVLVQDVADALFLAMEVSGIEGKTFNLAGDVRPSAAEYVGLVARQGRRPFRFYPRPFSRIQAIEFAKWLAKMVARKAENQRQTLHDVKSRAMISPIDCTAAKRSLGWRPVDNLEVFVREAIDCHLKPIPAGDLRLAAKP